MDSKEPVARALTWGVAVGILLGLVWQPLTAYAGSAGMARGGMAGSCGVAAAVEFDTSVQTPYAMLGIVDAGTVNTTGALPFNCLKTDGTCQLTSNTADATTSATVGAITLKCGANIAGSDLCLDVQNSAGGHIATFTEDGSLALPASQAVSIGSYFLSNNGANGRFFLGSASLTGDGTLWLGTIALLASSGDVLDATSGGYVRIKNGAGAPAAGDCDNAGEVARLYVDTTNDRFYWCDGAAGWMYSNEDVP